MLTVTQLTLVHRGRTVLDALDLHVATREIVALVGPAEAGKTAVLECIAGLRAPTAGRIAVAGFDPTREPREAAAHLAFAPARLEFPETRTGLAHARDCAAAHGRRIPEPVLRAALLRAGLPTESHDRRIAGYAPALRRKLALALALLENTNALLLDEPAADLDAADTTALIETLRRIRRRDAAILLATRDLAFAQRLATRIVLLEEGAVVETIDPHASRRTFHADSYLAELV